MVKLTVKKGIINEYEGNVRELHLPEGIKSIKNVYPEIFEDHTELTDVYLNEGLTRIGDRAFAGCIGLKNVVIPDGVTYIGNDVFENCHSLKSIIIPDSVTNIGAGAFKGCTGLQNITLSNNLSSLSSSIFEGCTSLKEITIPDNVEMIEYGAFSGCSGLIRISFPEKLQIIDQYAFQDCSALKSIFLPENVKTIDKYAFSGCTKLSKIKLPDNLEYIFDHAFESCERLTEVEISKNIRRVGYEIFDRGSNILINGEKFLLIYGSLVTYTGNDSDVVIPEGAMYIEQDLFHGHEEITSLIIPNSVTHIGKRALKNCTGLTSLDIPNSVVIIESEAFAGCRNLTNVTIPESVIKIGTKFEEDIFSNPEDDIFFGCLKSKLKLHVHENSSAMAYAERLGWKYKKIKKSGKPAASDFGEKPTPKTIEFLIDIKSKLFNGDIPCDGFFDFEHQDLFVNFEAAGTMYEGRTENIENVNVGDILQVVRDLQNGYNSENFRILTEQGKDVGNMPADICNAMSSHFDHGRIHFYGVTASYVEPLSKRGKLAKKGVLFVALHCGPVMKEKPEPTQVDDIRITKSAEHEVQNSSNNIRANENFIPETSVFIEESLIEDEDAAPAAGSVAKAELDEIIPPVSEITSDKVPIMIEVTEKSGGNSLEQAILDDTDFMEPDEQNSVSAVEKREINDLQLAAEVDQAFELLEQYYPEHKVFSLDSIDKGLRAKITGLYEKIGYASDDEMLRAYGFEFIFGDAVKEIRDHVEYTPGNEPDMMKSKVESMLLRLEEYYPDHVITGTLAREHKNLAGAVSGLYQWFGYQDAVAMLAAYGYTYNLPKIGSEQVNDYNELIRILAEKYKTGQKPKNMAALIRENPEFKAQLKTLQNNQYKILGMKATDYFIKAGICDPSGSGTTEDHNLTNIDLEKEDRFTVGTDMEQAIIETVSGQNIDEGISQLTQTADQDDDRFEMDSEVQISYKGDPRAKVQTIQSDVNPDFSLMKRQNGNDSEETSSELYRDRSDDQINGAACFAPIDQKAAWIRYQASEVAYGGRASAYFFFDLRNEMTLGIYNWQSVEFLNFYLKYFPGMSMAQLSQLRTQAVPWLNDPNTCNSQYQIVIQDSFEHRYVMLASAWLERAMNYDPLSRVQFVFNSCRSFFYPQEQQTVWQRLYGEVGL